MCVVVPNVKGENAFFEISASAAAELPI